MSGCHHTSGSSEAGIRDLGGLGVIACRDASREEKLVAILFSFIVSFIALKTKNSELLIQ